MTAPRTLSAALTGEGQPPVVAEWRGMRIGAELEFFVVDRHDLQPRDHLDLLLEEMDPETIRTEIAREHVELVSQAVLSMAELEENLSHLVRRAQEVLEPVSAVLLPVSMRDTAAYTMTDRPRYHELVRVFGPAFWENASTIVSDQVNLGASDEAGAFRIFEAITAHLPLFMGFSAASPFLEGRANGIASNRMYRYDACVVRHPSLVGVPPRLRSMAEYNERLSEQPVLRHPNMFYRYARPMPHRGVAAEIRCIDKQPTLKGFLALVALARAVVGEAMASEDAYDLQGVEEAFRRARAEGVFDPHGWEERIVELAAHLPEHERSYLEPLRRRLRDGAPADRLRADVEARGMRAVMLDLADGYLEGGAREAASV